MVIIEQLIHNTLVFSTALIFTALGGIYSERSGVINIGLEGLMISGAFASAITVFFADQAGIHVAAPWLGLLAAIVFGVLISLIHAVASITFKADQVVSGVAINFLALGITVYMVKVLFHGSGQTNTLVSVFRRISIPYLSDIPFLGYSIFTAYPTTYIAIFVVFFTYFVLFKTRFGLRLRAVGEHPSAADTLGVNVNRMRYIAVMISGALGGLGGATIALTTTSNFSHNTIAGQGFIALAAMIFGKWHPIGAFGAALFFGMATGLRNVLQLTPLGKAIPTELIFILPYVLTIIVLASAVGRASAPSALGKPYEPGSR